MMPCAKCNSPATAVVDSRWRPEFKAVWRRHHCVTCQHKWTTFEHQDKPVTLDLRKLIKLIDEMEGKMAEAVKEFREAVK